MSQTIKSRGDGRHTGVDQLLCRYFPTSVRLDLGLELANLSEATAISGGTMKLDLEGHTVSDGSASMTNLFCFKSYNTSEHRINIGVVGRNTLKVIFMLAGGLG